VTHFEVPFPPLGYRGQEKLAAELVVLLKGSARALLLLGGAGRGKSCVASDAGWQLGNDAEGAQLLPSSTYPHFHLLDHQQTTLAGAGWDVQLVDLKEANTAAQQEERMCNAHGHC
jgi:hypothetical protein